MNILLVSNEYNSKTRIGNPVICRLQGALRSNPNIRAVEFVPFDNTFHAFSNIRKAAKRNDIVHIQFGGLYAFLIWLSLIGIKKPKLLTFHGTDIHAKEIKTTSSYLVKLKIWANQKASFISILLFDKLGFVSDSLYQFIPKWIAAKSRRKMFIQPLGVDFNVFVPISKADACERIGIDYRKKYVLFSDKSSAQIKRRDIAEKIVDELQMGYHMLVMSGVKSDLVPYYINASDFILITSDEEGSPNIVREALALNKRIFSVDVGDIKNQISGLKNSSIIYRDPREAALRIRLMMKEEYSDYTRIKMMHQINIASTTEVLVSIYKNLLKQQCKTTD